MRSKVHRVGASGRGARSTMMVAAMAFAATAVSFDGRVGVDPSAPVVYQAPDTRNMGGEEVGREPGVAAMTVFSVIGGLVGMVANVVDIASTVTDTTGAQMDTMIEGVNKISAQVSELKDQMTAYSDETRKKLEDINIKLSQLLLENKDLALSSMETDIETKYGKFSSIYSEYNGMTDAARRAAFSDDTFKKKIQSACAGINLDDERNTLVNYRKLMCGSSGSSGALYALTDLLMTKMAATDANTRISPATAYDNLRRYFTGKLIYQDCELFVIKEYVYGVDDGSTTAQRETKYNEYLNSFVTESLAPEMTAFLECVDKIILCEADLKSLSNRGGVVSIIPTLKNAVGDVYFSPEIAGQIYFDADFIAACAAPTLYSFGAKCRLIGEPWKFPEAGTANLAAKLSDGSNIVDMTSDGVFLIAKAAYIQWISGGKGSYSFKMARQVNSSRWSSSSFSAPATLTATVYSTDGKTPLASGTISLDYYDKATGGVATSSTKSENKVLYGSHTFAANRFQPEPCIVNASVTNDSFYGSAPKSWNSLTTHLNTDFYWSKDKPMNMASIEFWGESTGVCNYGGKYTVSAPFFTIKNAGDSCTLTVEEQFKAMSRATSYLYTKANWRMILASDAKSEESTPTSDVSFGAGYAATEATFKAETSLKNGGSATVSNRMIADCNLASFFGGEFACCRFGSEGVVYEPYTTWNYPVTFSVTPVLSTDFNGSGQSKILVDRKTSTAARNRGADAASTLSVVSIDAKGKVAFDLPIQGLSVDENWSLVGAANFDEAYLPGLAFYDSAQRAFFSVPLSCDSDAVTAGDAQNVVALQLAEGQEFAGVGDFDGEGHSDILVRDTATGALAIYYVVFGALSQDPATVAGYTVASTEDVKVGDFNGDGLDDIILRDASSNDCVMVLMAADGSMTAEVIFSSMSSAWTIRETGDFDGNGMDDLLLVEVATGVPAIFLMDGADVLMVGRPKIPGSPWKNGGAPLAVGDYNGDGHADILWGRKDKKALTLSVSFMDGLSVCKSKLGKSGPIKLKLGLNDQVVE